MNLSESMEKLSDVGRPNPNFQRLISYIEPTCEEQEASSDEEQFAQPANPSTPSLKPLKRKSFQDFIRATVVDVDPRTGGPCLRHKIIYKSTLRKVQAHSSLMRRKKFTNLHASSMHQKCIPEELLENSESELKVLWVRGQSPDSSFNLTARRVPAEQ